jgi:GT2 family glycosyltransferase
VSNVDAPIPEVSVLIVTWNSGRYIEQCLRSIHERTQGCTFEVIVVDNGSRDETCQIIEKDFPTVRLVNAGANLGFAKATNLAIREAKGRLLLLLNPDTCLQSDGLAEMVQFLDAHPEVGAVGPRLVELSGATNEYAVRGFPSLRETFLTESGLRSIITRKTLFGTSTPIDWTRLAAMPVPAINGAVIMTPRDVIERVGLLDEQLPMYFEDLDICKRIGLAGKQLYYLPTTSVLHLEGQSAEISPARPMLFAMEHGQAPWMYFKTYRGKLAASLYTIEMVLCSLWRLVILYLQYPVARLFAPGRVPWMRHRIVRSLAVLKWALGNKSSFNQRAWALFK